MSCLLPILRLSISAKRRIDDLLLRLSIVLALGVLSVRGDGCTLGRPNLPQTSPNPTPGLFIDRENPSICSGQITDWRICYYNPRNFNSRDTIRILLQTWRISDNRGSRISSYPTTLRIPQQPAIFQCVNISVDPTDYIDVEQGDFIAVYLFQDEVLPVIANRNDLSRVFFFPAGNNVPNAIEPSLPGLVSLSNQAIHISATIGTPDVAIDTTMVQLPMSTGLSSGAVAAIVIVLLMVIAASLFAMAGGLWYIRRYRKDESKQGNDITTMDNSAYGTPKPQEENYTSNYHSMVGSYEVPIKTLKKTSNEQRDLEGANRTLNTLFVDSTFEEESHAIGQEADEGQNMGGLINPYATLGPMMLKDYNTFLKEQGQLWSPYGNSHSKSTNNSVLSNPTNLSPQQTTNYVYSMPAEAPYSEPPNNEEDIYKELFKRNRTINRKSIKIISKIGEGAFSTVSKGLWTDGSSVYEVAVKELIKQSTKEDKIKMLQEAAILGQFRHPNVIKLFGVVKHGSAPMIVTEFLHKSDLLNVLLSMAPEPGQLVATDTPELLLSYSQQVCLGMHYLSSKGFVHRDLAARNILVTENDICKVGDFGLSRHLDNAEYYVSHGGMVPIRWTAPEAIFFRKYSSASDVWSYGCLLYEIWTLGIRPCEGIAIKKYLETQQAGYRLPPPPGCPLVIYRTMIECWHPEASERPTFTSILSVLLNETLSIPIKDASSHLQASNLGASLEAGLEMYKDLQNTYLKKQSIPKQKHRTVTSTQKPSATAQSPAPEDNIYEAVNGGDDADI